MRKFLTWSLILTLFVGVTSCSSSDDSVYRQENKLNDFIGQWETNEISYDFGGSTHTYKFSEMPPVTNPDRIVREIITISYNTNTDKYYATLVQFTGRGEEIPAVTSEIDKDNTATFEAIKRSYTLTDKTTLLSIYPFTHFGTTLDITVSYNKIQ